MIYLMKTDCHDPATLINPKHFRNIVSACPPLIRANKHEHRYKQTVHDVAEYFTKNHRVKMHECSRFVSRFLSYLAPLVSLKITHMAFLRGKKSNTLISMIVAIDNILCPIALYSSHCHRNTRHVYRWHASGVTDGANSLLG